jgi:hypothetical protein
VLAARFGQDAIVGRMRAHVVIAVSDSFELRDARGLVTLVCRHALVVKT